MTRPRFTIFILGLAAAIVPARASLTYQASQTSFSNQATVTDGLTLTSLITFTGTLSEFGSVTNDEYIDPTTGVEFIAFNGTGTTNKSFTVSGGDLNLPASSGDSIKVILPTGTYGFAANFTTTFSPYESLCMDVSTSTFSTCASGGTVTFANTSGFVGTLDDNPTPATFTTIWLHPQSSGSAGTDLQSFEIAELPADPSSGVPDPATMLTLGAGLIFLALLRRRPRLFRFLHR
jgi:PEP-CTERM motif-containing protein